MKNTRINNLRYAAAPLALSLAMVATPSFAQDEAADSDSNAPIVVTGSRIPQPNLEGASPVTVLSAEDAKLQGTTRIEDLINSLPQVSAGQAAGQSNGATGTATVDLRGLGPVRTLVLINGKRLLPGDPIDSAADLNVIPSSLVKRVEVLTGGASSTYGADAVAGVVNFILDKEFEGLRLDTQYSFYQHNNRNKLTPPLLDARAASGLSGYDYPTGSVTDGGTIDATLSIGGSFDDGRGHAVGYFGYRKVNEVVQRNRDYSACTIQNSNGDGSNLCGGSATSPVGTIVVYDNGTSTLFQIGPNRTLDPFSTRFNFAPFNFYQRPDERYTGGVFLDYEISDSIKPYLEFNFMDDVTDAQIAPSGNFGNTLLTNCDNPLIGAAQLAVICDTENLVNGFLGSFPLTPTSNPGFAPIDFFDPLTGTTYNQAFFQPLRRNVEGGPRNANLQHTSYRGVIGVKGDLDPVWSYDAYYQYGRTVYAQTYTNELSASRLSRALDVVDVNGVPTCRSVTSGLDPACIPYDIFGGTISQEALGYLGASGFQRATVSQQVASASFTGLLGDYGVRLPWASDGVAINVGFEYRKDALDLKTDNAFSTGDLTGQGAATLPVKGSYYVVEGFGELNVPIVQDSFFYDLSFSTGYRYSKYYISNGNRFSTDTYKFGLEFAPIRDIRMRASYNRAVRAPNIQELFAPLNVQLDGSVDPCAGFVITAADLGCLAQGLSVGQTVAANPAGQYNGLVGGSFDLLPEKATTKTLGLILQPSFLPGASLTLDYFDIKVADAIQGFGSDAIVTTCTNTADPTVCALVNRNPVSGSIWLTPDGYITNLQQNIGGVKTKGLDVNAQYSTEIGSAGSLSFSFIGTYLDKLVIDNGISTPYDCAGYYGPNCSAGNVPSAPNPEWRHKARVSYNSPGGIGVSLQWRYFGSVDVEFNSTNPSLASAIPGDPGSHISAQSYFDLAATMNIADSYTFRLGVNNILDRQPPLVTSGSSSGNYGNACPTGPCNGNTYPAVYDALGRYIYAGITLDF